ncbi:lipid II flippase MurJ [Fredinandcohnia onubensis]|uniref:lipid II flippase MurJ n=1 Tax=Fredinandcohnia onubensis TaxID=1571209 RepID=UPI000C0BB973|nr:lipid II flippase MurJ [Fredinandcohnia onubensis]
MFASLMKKSNFKQAVKVIFLFDIFVRGIQFIREVIFSTFYGFSKITDAFNFTVNILGTPINLIADALLVGIIPALNKKEDLQNRANYVYSLIITFFLIITTLFILFFVFFNPLMTLLAPGFDNDTISITLKFSLFYCAIGLFLVLNRIIDNFFKAEKVFGIASYANLISSIISIIILVILYKTTIYAITIGMLVGTLISFIILLRKLPFKTFTKYDKDVLKLIKNSIPLLISGGLGVINTFVDKSFATIFEPGTLTILSYSTMIVILSSSIITNAVSGASYSFIASEISKNELKKAQTRISQINLFFVAIFSVISILFILFGKFFLSLLFLRGNITPNDIDLMYKITLVFIPMSIFTSTGTVVLQTFYSYNNTKVTTVVNSLCVLLHIALNFIFIDHFGVYALAGSTLVSSILATLINSLLLAKKYKITAINIKMAVISLLVALFTVTTLLNYIIYIKYALIILIIVLFFIMFKNEIKSLNIKRFLKMKG